MVHFDPHGLLMPAGPDPLQIRRQTVGTRGADQQVAGELEIKFLQAEVVGPRADALYSFIGGQGFVRIGRGAKMKCHAPVHRPVDGLLPGENLRGAVGSGLR